jgi:RNA polymerase sigma factor (sigma-70 family)
MFGAAVTNTFCCCTYLLPQVVKYLGYKYRLAISIYVCQLPAMKEMEKDDIDPVELWTQLRAGNADAYGRLIKIYYRELHSYGTRFTKDEELVKDCIQDLFLTIWKNRQTIGDTAFVKYYLIKSLRRLIARAMDKNKWFSLSHEPEFDAGFGTALSAENIMIRDEMLLEQSNKMRFILSKLSKRQQEVIYLRFYLDADIADIADIMSISRQSVYNLLHDALKKLKEGSGGDDSLASLMLILIGLTLFGQ